MSIEVIFRFLCVAAILLGSVILFMGGVFVLFCVGLKKEFFMRHPNYVAMEKEKGAEETRQYYARLGELCLLFGLVGGISVVIINSCPVGYYIPSILFLVWSLTGKWVLGRLPVKSRTVQFLLICVVMALIGLLWWKLFAVSGGGNIYFTLILPYAAIAFLLWLDLRVISRW